MKNYNVVTIEKKSVNDPDGLGVGHFNEHTVEHKAHTKQACRNYIEKKSLWHCDIMTNKQLELSKESTGIDTI